MMKTEEVKEDELQRDKDVDGQHRLPHRGDREGGEKAGIRHGVGGERRRAGFQADKENKIKMLGRMMRWKEKNIRRWRLRTVTIATQS